MISPSNLLRLICIQHLLWTRCGAFSGSFSKSIPLLWRTSSLIVVFDLELYSCSSASPQTRQIFISEKTAGKRVLRFNSLVRYGTCACPRGFYSRIQAGGSVAGFVVTMVKPGIGAAQCAAACRGKEPNQTLNLARSQTKHWTCDLGWLSRLTHTICYHWGSLLRSNELQRSHIQMQSR